MPTEINKTLFEFDRVKFSELNVPDQEKENMIKKLMLPEIENKIRLLEVEGMKALFYKEIGQNKDELIINIGSKIEDYKHQIDNFDYTKYLEEIV